MVMVCSPFNTSPIPTTVQIVCRLCTQVKANENDTGHGRRLCPGIHLADRNLFHAISKILWAFNIEKATDPATGKPIEPDTDVVTGYREGLTACAYDFPVKLTVRSQARRDAIEREYKEARANFFPQYEKADFFS